MKTQKCVIRIRNQYSRTKFFQGKELFFKNQDSNIRCKNQIEDNNEKNAVDSSIQFLTKSILRPMVSTGAIRQRGS